MRFHTESEYRTSSPESGFSAAGPAVCTAIRLDDRAYFLSIAEATESFQGDPEFRRMNASDELRTFNPFQPTAFEPQNAALVILSFVQRA